MNCSPKSYDARMSYPSYRQIVDLGNINDAQFMIPSGQSGVLGSVHYDDMIKDYLDGKFLPMYFTNEQVSKNLEGVLNLKNI